MQTRFLAGLRRTVAAASASMAGAGLAAVFRAVAALRRDRPLHPRGVSLAAVAEIRGTADTGVPWLDTPGTTPVTLRVSRATGLPRPLPDIHGLAVRVPGSALGGGDDADLLFASTGSSALTRFLLVPRRHSGAGPLTTLLPLRTARGPLLLRLAPEGGLQEGVRAPASYALSYAMGTGRWRDVGQLVVGAMLPEHVDRVRHDPVLHLLPGTAQYASVVRLREPSYRAARSVRPQH